jgi:hypothetical protein
MPADVQTSDEEFEQPSGPIQGEKGRERIGGHGVLIGMVLMAITRKKSTGELLWRPLPERRGGDDCGKEGVGADAWAQVVSETREGEGTDSGLRGSGPWAICGTGPNGFPGSISIFISSFPFFFFCFLN